jgi:hypothetical protein
LLGEQAFFAFVLLIVDLLAFLEGPKAFAFDGGEVDEDVAAFGAEDEAVTFFGIKPLYGPNRHGGLPIAGKIAYQAQDFKRIL